MTGWLSETFGFLRVDPTLTIGINAERIWKELAKVCQTTPTGREVASFVSYLRYARGQDLAAFARAQHPLLREWEGRLREIPK